MQKDYACNSIICTCEIGAYLKSIVDDLVIVCDKIINLADTLKTNSNDSVIKCDEIIIVANSVSINCDDKSKKYIMSCCIFHMILLVVLLLVIIVTIYFYYIKYRSKQKVLSHWQFQLQKIMN